MWAGRWVVCVVLSWQVGKRFGSLGWVRRGRRGGGELKIREEIAMAGGEREREKEVVLKRKN